MAIPYYEKLKDPRWQKLRLMVMERENFTCEMCGATDKTLNVHHGYYEPGYDPWDYRPDTLHCVCVGCHEVAQSDIRDLQMEIGRINPKHLMYFMPYIQEFQQRVASGDYDK